MNHFPPLYTETAECQDCYKCLRQCSVKAIKIREGHAMIIPELCIRCGHCVEICPVGAKRIRDDVERARLLLRMKSRVVVSLAPSWIADFAGLSKEKMIRALSLLGFYGVSETALGAQEVSANVAGTLAKEPNGIFISSACPTAVELVKKYHPEVAGRVMNMLSPVLAHAKLLRREFGDDIGIVFISPCVSKKLEADSHPSLLDVSITFEDLRRWWENEHIDPYRVTPDGSERFIPKEADEGALYPVDGGMIAGIKANCEVNDARFMAFSGIANIKRVLEDAGSLTSDKPLFIELLACEGGCVNGPRASKHSGTIVKRHAVIENAAYSAKDIPRKPTIDIDEMLNIEPVVMKSYSEEEIADALHRVGKFSKEDELNCGGCGYDSCREFARALLDGTAEENMCVGYMRKLALKKANALIRTMPSGVVIVDKNLKIVESNRRFAEILGRETMMIYEAQPGLEGADLKKVIPFHQYFRTVLNDGHEMIDKDIKIDKMVLHLSVFTIEPHHLVGGLIQDITAPSVQKARIVDKAQDVIKKNLETVQKIAYLLGENAADSEVILNSIINSFPTETIDESKTDE